MFLLIEVEAFTVRPSLHSFGDLCLCYNKF